MHIQMKLKHKKKKTEVNRNEGRRLKLINNGTISRWKTQGPC